MVKRMNAKIVEEPEEGRIAQTRIAVVALLTLLLAAQLRAAEPERLEAVSNQTRPGAGEPESLMELAKKTQNPVPDQIKLQFQDYVNFGLGPNDVNQNVLSVIPTIPFKLSDEWNLVTRTTIPTINQPSLGSGIDSAFGLGDINPQFYLVPREHGAFLWGLGPSFTLPTATDSILGAGKWTTGPGALVVLTQGPWVIGSRINNMWSFAGWGPHDVNELWVQPFVHYNFPGGWYLASLPTYTANWKASSDNVWTVPVGGGVGKHFRLVKGVSFDVQVQSFCNVVRPAGAADWNLFFEIQFLFPKRK